MIAKSLIQSGLADTVKVFYSYSRKDSIERDLIEKAIVSFDWDIETETWKRDMVQQWYDEGLQGGDKWDPEIKNYLNLADIILLFVTKNFFKSKYIRDVELKIALEKENKGSARVIPILIDHTSPSWLETDFGYLQPLPKNCLPINEWENKEAALNDVAQGIVDIIVSEGLLPNSRSRWQIHLDTDIEKFNKKAQKNLIVNLRKIANDGTLRYLKMKIGSVILTMESTRDGLNKILKAKQSGVLSKEIGYSIFTIIELLGANIHGGTFVSGKETLKRPEKFPDNELILLPSKPFVPVLFKGIRIDKNNPLQFNNIVDSGDDISTGPHLENEVSKLLEYFLTSIATPQDELFVNLAPDENARLLSETLKDTRLGRDLLEIDYKLKRLSASLIHPDTDSGKEFWPKVFERTVKEISNSELIFNAFLRVWLVPDKAKVYEGLLPNNDSLDELNIESYKQAGFMQGFVVDQHLTVSVNKEDLEQYSFNNNSNLYRANEIFIEVYQEIIIPLIEFEINEGKNFSECRQIYNSMILAIWIKKNKYKIPNFKKYIDSKKPRQLIHQITNIEPYSLDQKEDITNTNATSDQIKGIDNNHFLDENIHDSLNSEFEYGQELREGNKLNESEKILRSILNKRVKMYSEGHYQIQIAMSQLGKTLRENRKIKEAVALHEKVLEIRRNRYGNLHEYTINSMLILSDTLILNDEIFRARALQAEAAENKMRTSKAFEIHENRVYYEKYLDVFKNGVFYLERYDYDKHLTKKIPRVYFSGAIDFRNIPQILK